MKYGFIQSKLDGTEQKFEEIQKFKIPESYSFRNYLPQVINQGSRPICVPCSISAYLNWKINLANGENTIDNNIDLNEIYNSKTTEGDDGMTFKDALHFLKHKGVDSDLGNQKIDRYAMIGSEICLKQAIILNGPCIGGLPVYDDNAWEFWKNKYDGSFKGGHAISIVGYNKEGFIIRNSWGKGYGDNGYYILPYEDFNNFYEIWTIID